MCFPYPTRPDLDEIDVDVAADHLKEARKYVDRCGIDRSTEAKYYTKTNDEKPFPKAEKYKTPAAKDYFDGVKTYKKMMSEDVFSLYTPERKQLHEKLVELLKTKKDGTITTPVFDDPVTGDHFTISTDLFRAISMICLVYSGEVSNEEILDMVEGLTLCYREDIDLNDEDQRLYARNRYLSSMHKLFKLEFDNMKRYENTYGTLGDELPFAVFFDIMGDGQRSLP